MPDHPPDQEEAMTRELRVPERGARLYGDGDRAVVADNLDQARVLLGTDEAHSMIGVCRVVSAADVEAGDCHEDAEPGDTTIDYRPDDGGVKMGRNECRVWVAGPPSWGWRLEPFTPPISLSEVPVGTVIRDAEAEEWVRIVDQPAEGDAALTVEPEHGGERRRYEPGDSLAISPTFNNWRPPVRYRLHIRGEVAEGTREEMEQLRRDAIEALNDEWRRSLPPAKKLCRA